jgi:hypothetical protein
MHIGNQPNIKIFTNIENMGDVSTKPLITVVVFTTSTVVAKLLWVSLSVINRAI